MRESTVQQLNALNHTFYETIAMQWHQSRKTAWSGFARVLDALPAEPTSVLDVGAGDGRFAAYLSERLATPFEYTGIDASQALLELARARKLAASCRFVHADFLRDDQWEPKQRFSLIVLLGVLHHVPSLALRTRLLTRVAARLAPGGSLALTFWRLAEDARFARRRLPVTTYNATASQPIPHDDLEPGDTLVRWGAGDAPPRYCHMADDAEIAALVASTGLEAYARFRSDGRGDALNEYVILRAAEPQARHP